MLCFRKLLVVKKFMDTKGGVGFSKLSVEELLSNSTKHFVEEPSSAVFQKNSGGEEVYGKEGEGGSLESFRRKFFVSNCRKTS